MVFGGCLDGDMGMSIRCVLIDPPTIELKVRCR